MSASRPSEFELIDRYFRPLAGRAGLGLADDAAVLSPDLGTDIVITTDMIVEGVDFLDDPPETIAAKALRVNLSDLAAKGADPFAYLLTLGLRDDWTEAWVAGFASGLARDHGRYGVELIGGDTGRTGERMMISITAFGRVPSGRMVTRNGASPGDVVLVSGTIGDAALGLRVLKGELEPATPSGREHLVRRYRLPEPRAELAPLLRRFATTGMDISDGLAADLDKLCVGHGLGAEVAIADVPLSDAAHAEVGRRPGLMEAVLSGGDDYEVLFTVLAPRIRECVADAARLGVPCRPIGRVVDGDAVLFTDAAGQRLDLSIRGFEHFRVES